MSSRLSIAGLMGVVLVAALGMAALRSASEAWAGVMCLLTCAVLALGSVGVVCGAAADRSWWLGFAVFGWGYLAWAFAAPYEIPGIPSPPTIKLLCAIGASGGGWGPRPQASFFDADGTYSISAVGHCLWTLPLAALGGVMARVLYPQPQPGPAGGPGGYRAWAGRCARGGWPRPAVAGLVGFSLLAFAALAASRTALGLWAGATVLLAWGLLALAALGATFCRGIRRARWLGATLFGVGYLALVSPHVDDFTWTEYATNRLLDGLRPWLPAFAPEHPAATNAVAAANFRVLSALEQTVPIRFEKTPLQDIVKYVLAATRGPDGKVIPIYVDPIGLNEAEKTMDSPVSLVLEGVPLRTTLRLLLRQLGMTYEVGDGLLMITSEGCHDGYHEPIYRDPFLLTGQSLLALVAAVLGAALAPLVVDPGVQSS